MNKRIVNLSSYELTLTEKQALCLGLDFAIAPRRVKQIEMDAEFESLFQQLTVLKPLPEDQHSLLRAELVKVSKTYGNCRIDRSCLLPCHVDALTKLKKNTDVILLRPDKGSGVIVMDTCDYHRKFEPILNDRSKLKVDEQQEDASVKVAKSVSKLLNDLKTRGVISLDQHRHLQPKGAVPPRLYGLPKTHKEGVPIRPIVCMTRCALESLSKWLAATLNPIENSFTTRCVKDSFEFVEKLAELDVPNTIMASFDVSALFTNVPVIETIDIIVEETRRRPDLCPLPLDLLRDMLLLCTCNVQFLFNNVFYRQTDGVAMGSALGPLFANVFMGHIERLLSVDIDSACLFYVRFMDDTFSLVRNKEEASKLLKLFNAVHPNLHFTTELESSKSLSFLEVLVRRRTDDSFSFSIFRKKTWTGVSISASTALSLLPISVLLSDRYLFVRSVCVLPSILKQSLIFFSMFIFATRTRSVHPQAQSHRATV